MQCRVFKEPKITVKIGTKEELLKIMTDQEKANYLKDSDFPCHVETKKDRTVMMIQSDVKDKMVLDLRDTVIEEKLKEAGMSKGVVKGVYQKMIQPFLL